MQTEKPSALNLPNALTLLRLLLIPVFITLMCRDQMMPALGVFVFASITDVADGWIARKYNLITDFGKLFDPLADKLMVLSVMTMMVVKGIAPLAAVIILVAKELLMLVGGFLLMKKHVVVYSLPIGKTAQFITVLALVLCFFHEAFAGWAWPPHLVMLWLGVALALVSMVYYGLRNGPKLFDEPQARQDEKTEE